MQAVMSSSKPAGNTETAWSEHDRRLIACTDCPRLVAWREEVSRVRRRAYRDETYWGRPVPGVGDHRARMLVVGLAPGAHGSNRTGRMFTGDASGEFLFPALFRAGFSDRSHSRSADDPLTLNDIFITAAVRCAPPQNRPLATEVANCRRYLAAEIALLHMLQGVVALGRLAYEEIFRLLESRARADSSDPGRDLCPPPPRFGHGTLWNPAGQSGCGQRQGLWVLASYHPSRQNTQTGRLTPSMFDEIWRTAKSLLRPIDAPPR